MRLKNHWCVFKAFHTKQIHSMGSKLKHWWPKERMFIINHEYSAWIQTSNVTSWLGISKYIFSVKNHRLWDVSSAPDACSTQSPNWQVLNLQPLCFKSFLKVYKEQISLFGEKESGVHNTKENIPSKGLKAHLAFSVHLGMFHEELPISNGVFQCFWFRIF